MTPWLCILCCFLICTRCAGDGFATRVRLHNGKVVRLEVAANSTLSALHQAIVCSGHYSDSHTDIVRFKGRALSAEDMSHSTEKVDLTDIGIVQLEPALGIKPRSGSPRAALRVQTGITAAANAGRKRKTRGSINDVQARRAAMLKLNQAETGAGNDTVHVVVEQLANVLSAVSPNSSNSNRKHDSSEHTVQGIALLLGKAVRNSDNTVDVWCEGAIEVSDAAARSAASIGRGRAANQAVQLSETSRFLVLQGVRLAELLGLQVVGCAIGGAPVHTDKDRGRTSGRESRGAKTYRSGRAKVEAEGSGTQGGWSAHHVHLALELTSLCRATDGGKCSADREATPLFVILSVQQSNEKGLQMEAHRLSGQTVALHSRGHIDPAVDTAAPRLVRLREPVLLGGGREASEVDALLLAVPLPLVREKANGSPEGAAMFPSLLQMQRDAASASAAQTYLRRLLEDLVGDSLTENGEAGGTTAAIRASRGRPRRRRELLRRLLDPHLMLYLSVLLGDGAGEPQNGSESPLALLCAEVRGLLAAPQGEGCSLSLSALATLDAIRTALTPP